MRVGTPVTVCFQRGPKVVDTYAGQVIATHADLSVRVVYYHPIRQEWREHGPLFRGLNGRSVWYELVT